MAILGMGTAVPQGKFTQSDALDHARLFCAGNSRQAHILKQLYRRTDINTRHSILRDMDASHRPSTFFPVPVESGDEGPTTQERVRLYSQRVVPLAVTASGAALDDAGASPGQIRHLITVSCTGFTSPGFDISLMKQLGLPSSASRTHIGFMGCHGALNGIRTALAQSALSPGDHILLCAAELCSVHFQYGWSSDNVIANSLFADGAAALVCTGLLDHREQIPIVTATGSCLFPDSEEAMTWTISNHGFVMTISPKVPALISKHLSCWLEGWLRQHDLTVKDIGSWSIHPGGTRVLDAVASSLGLAEAMMKPSRDALARWGNMSSPTVLFILKELRQAMRPCVMLAFGPGLSVEAALVR